MFGNASQGNEIFVPAPVDVVFAATEEAIRKLYKVKSADDFTKTVQFTTGISAMTYGDTGTVQVVPAEGGATLRIISASRVNNAFSGGRSQKVVRAITDEVIARVREAAK